MKLQISVDGQTYEVEVEVAEDDYPPQIQDNRPTPVSATIEMQAGKSFDEAIAEAQRLGVAEADPSADVDGIDAAVKVVEVANVLMGASLALSDVRREGIRGITCSQLQAAQVNGTSLLIAFETDIFKELMISERDPGPEATAYGMLSDFVNAVRST